ncbi:MAG: hypothetical protein ACK2UM_16880 [Anaerolineales bacterium]|jgi:hypothetical protein
MKTCKTIIGYTKDAIIVISADWLVQLGVLQLTIKTFCTARF